MVGGDSFRGTVGTAAVVESRADVRTVAGRLGQPNAGSSLPVQRRKGLRARVGVGGERERGWKNAWEEGFLRWKRCQGGSPAQPRGQSPRLLQRVTLHTSNGYPPTTFNQLPSQEKVSVWTYSRANRRRSLFLAWSEMVKHGALCGRASQRRRQRRQGFFVVVETNQRAKRGCR